MSTTGGSARWAAAILLLFTELVGFVVFAARARRSLRKPAEFQLVPGVPYPDLIAVVDGTNCDSGDLHATLLALRKCDGLRSIVVAGAPKEMEFQALISRLSATADDRPVHELVETASSAWVMVVGAGSIVAPDIVESVAPICSSADVAVVQVGIEDADPVSAFRDPLGRYSIQTFEQTVERRSMAAARSMPWFGDGPALVRRNAISAIGGFAEPLPAGSWEAGLAVARAGFRVVTVAETLARVRSSPSIEQAAQRQLPIQKARLRTTFRPRWWRGVSSGVALDHLAVAAQPLGGLYRWLQGAVVVLILGFAMVPIDATMSAFLVAAGPAYGVRWVSLIMLGRGTLRPASLARRDLQNMGLDLTTLLFGGAPRVAGGLGILIATLVAVAAAAVLGVAGVTADLSQQLAGDGVAGVLSLTSLYLGMGVAVLLDGYIHRRRRRDRRTRLGRVACRIGNFDGDLVDVSNAGAAVVVARAGPLPIELRAGSSIKIEFRIPDVDGAWRDISSSASVVYTIDTDGSTRLGMMFDEPRSGALDPLVEFLNLPRRRTSRTSSIGFDT